MTVAVQDHCERDLDQLRWLINCHLAGVVPGWQLPRSVIAASLRHRPGEDGPDPWVAERRTMCAREGDRLLGAAHVIRYGRGAAVGAGYRGAAELAWLLFWPDAKVTAQALLEAARRLIADWGAGHVYACDTSLPVPVISGVPESWPHVSDALSGAGFEPHAAVGEVLYGGRVPWVGGDEPPPVAGLEVRAATDEAGQSFRAELDGLELAFLQWSPDLSFGGTLPALAGWAQLSRLRVRREWRGRGIGPWIVRRTVPFLRMVGVSRVLVTATAREEARGARSLCRRLGWEPMVRLERGWTVSG